MHKVPAMHGIREGVGPHLGQSNVVKYLFVNHFEVIVLHVVKYLFVSHVILVNHFFSPCHVKACVPI